MEASREVRAWAARRILDMHTEAGAGQIGRCATCPDDGSGRCYWLNWAKTLLSIELVP